MNKFKDLFCGEAEDQIATLSNTLLLIEKTPEDATLYQTLMRSAHTIKGASATMGYSEMAALAHALEDVFHAGERGVMQLNSETITRVFAGVDLLSSALASIRDHDTELPTGEMVPTLRALLNTPDPSAVAPTPLVGKVHDFSPKINIPVHVKVGIERLDTLMGLFEEMLLIRLKLDTILEPVLEIAQTVQDPLLKQRLFFVHEFKALFEQMARLLTENQDALLAIRLVPLDQIFSQYPRMVRDLALREGKKVEFIMEGGSLDLDRSVLDGLGGALAHLLRNAIDHGITTEGTIRLTAKRVRSRAHIIVEDDGAGIDYERVRAVAVERGVLPLERAKNLDNPGVAELLFHPNMSTNDTVTDVSGRGVGLFAVRSFVEDMNGRIEVESPIKGTSKGTRFILDLPVTLATLRVMTIRSAGYTFAIPFDSIARTLEFTDADVLRALEQENVMVDGVMTPLLHLEKLLSLTVLGYPGASLRRKGARICVVVRTERNNIALEVDQITGEQELLVKSLPTLLRGIKGFSGSTLLPDGRTVLLLDAHGLLMQALNDILDSTQEKPHD